MGHNPLTGLPGNLAIEEETRRRLARQGNYAYSYIDLDNFKAYNDVYGIKQGDKVIRLFADILIEAVKRWGNPHDFVGHVGGDDFIAITTGDKAPFMFDWVAKRFDERIRAYYSESDLKSGCITAKDRQGNIKTFSFVSASIVYITDSNTDTNQYPLLIQALTEMKSYVKHNLVRKGGSIVFQDRRGGINPPSIRPPSSNGESSTPPIK
jgi:diguanylate cyclase (GGDEF)-like protein